jgi:ornithine cyclodeaminase/alanine dehydrogenase-like protein (mu-crystallin family)
MTATLLILSGDDVARHLSDEACIPLMREAMMALSRGETRQLLRAILDLEGGRLFGSMPGAMDGGAIGAQLISVFPRSAGGAPSHQGVVALFDPASGAPVAIVEAGELTAIRTAAASAAATDALARPDSRRLAVLGTGEQALRHVEAIRHVRAIEEVRIWGRSFDKAAALAERIGGLPVQSAEAAAAGADIVCTTTASAEPVLLSQWVAEGTHLNLVGSSRAGPVEVDNALVARARFFADHEDGVRRQGAEWLKALAEGAVGEDHLLGEIGEVMAGTLPGRTSSADVTIYKSLGSIVQDLAAGWFLVEKASAEGFGTFVPI